MDAGTATSRPSGPTVVVVGAGIVGAAVAYELARAGAEVVVLEKALPAAGVTGGSFAWIGGPKSWDVPDGSTPVRRRVLREYRRLESEVPGLGVRWSGSLTWGGDEERRPGWPDERVVDAEAVARLEPHLAHPPPRALHLTGDGAVDPVAVTRALVRAACARGARLVTACAATAVRVDAGRVVGVETSVGFVPATRVVLAAGVDTAVLCAPLGLDLPVAPSPALLMRFSGPPGLVRTLVATPDLEVRELAPGRLVVAAGYGGETDEEQLLRAGEQMRSRLAATFTGADGLRLDGVRLGARPMPVDGLPVVGPVPGAVGVHVAVMHSGVTLAPAVAALLAPEVVGGTPAGELAGVRPDRFAGPAG